MDPGRGARTWRWVWAIVAALFVLSLIGASLLPVPYYALRPGSAVPLDGLLAIEGVDEYPTDAPVAYTTVRVGRATLVEALIGWVDDDVDVLRSELIDGGRSADENDRYNQALMVDSKQVAIAVALRRLGHPVTITTAGVRVEAVVAGQPAEGVLQRGDVVRSVDGEVLDRPGELGQLLQVGGPGATHELGLVRPPATEPTTVSVTTAAAADDPSRAVVGIVPREQVAQVDLPFDVAVDSGDVGGPSAGLAFTLAIVDHLSPGDLTGGLKVAVTGTMSLDGVVGPVGGAVQKAVAVRDAGYDLFLVPSAEYDAVQAKVGRSVEVVAVDTLDQALEALAARGGAVPPAPVATAAA
ncbi:MAG: PDZ domain-containing protein [Acidimicrobiia bacterium]